MRTPPDAAPNVVATKGDITTEVAVSAVRDATTAVESVRFVCFDDETRALYERLLEDL